MRVPRGYTTALRFATSGFDFCDHIIHGEYELISIGFAQGDFPLLQLTLTKHQHIRDSLLRALRNSACEAFLAQVDINAQSHCTQTLFPLHRLFLNILAHWQNSDLQGTKPRRQERPMMLQQDSQEAFQGSIERTVQHHTMFPLTGGIGVTQVKSFGHHQVKLNGSALPISALAVSQNELNLRAIKSTRTRLFPIMQATCDQRISQSAFRLVPLLISPGAICGP